MTEGEHISDDLPATLTEPEGVEGFAPGQILAERYRVRELLGRGGVGEVWRAFDLKLRVEVALKALRGDLISSEKRLERLRREVRAAREVVSPNVCRIFDLVEVEGRELVSMEYVDGETLLEVLHDSGPLKLNEAQDIASQFLAGLEAIHAAGLVHRDIKPENIMLTRSGRVVVMDFGLAREETEGSATGSGTPAYMAPEQAAGQALDARADVYAAGVVLAEMVTPDGVASIDSRQSVWEGVRSEPAKLPETPWTPVIKKAVAGDREGRYPTAHTLTRALEDVTLRVEGAEDLHPYPGLASFTEDDAEYFFGREGETEQMWRRLEGPSRMLALVGPSGAGKSSFLRAGLMPSAGPGWAAVILTPGNDPQVALRRAVIVELKDDTEALRELAEGSEDASVSAVARWRRRHESAVVIVDQFEELFTQTAADEQQRFAMLLNRLVLEAGVCVLLSMRDDFLIHCNRHEELRPLFSELTPLDPPAGAALRRALTQPGLQCGYRFEDDELVEEMLVEVEGERGALPLLAFAAAKLWEKRDRDTGLLTRTAFYDIGGVGGALARHAEATIDRLGSDRIPIVRELFRNLVTADGTRTVREWSDLLSIFRDSQRESAAAVLSALIDARLLTAYEVKEEERAPTRRLEIVHESLLANWPRLVRWQTQDADAAQLRDQLRQAARTWHEHDRSDDTLWTGAAYREFTVWRERYPGGLSDIEDAFAKAMTSLATRRKRRRRLVSVIVVVFLTVVATVFGTLWRSSVLETRRAEAARLLAVAEVQIETDPTEALAYATASLELADNLEARVFATRALSAGPPVRALDIRRSVEGTFWVPTFSPDGRWLAVAPLNNENVVVYGERGGDPIVLGGHPATPTAPVTCEWSRNGFLATSHPSENPVRIWSVPEGRLVRTIDFEGGANWQMGEKHLLAEIGPGAWGQPGPTKLMRWKLPDGVGEDLGTVDLEDVGATNKVFDPSGEAWLYSTDDGAYSRPLPVEETEPDRLFFHASSGGVHFARWGRPVGIRTFSSDGIMLWTATEVTSAPVHRLPWPETASGPIIPDPAGRWFVELKKQPAGQLGLWNVTGLREAIPRALKRSGFWHFATTDFHPTGDWVVANTHDMSEISFWPLSARRPDVVEGSWYSLGFTPDGRYLVTHNQKADEDGMHHTRLWPVPGTGSPEIPDLKFPSVVNGMKVDANNEYAVTSWYGGGHLIPLNGEELRVLEGFPGGHLIFTAFSPSGRRVAGATGYTDGQPALRVWDLETGEVEKVFDQPTDPEAAQGDGFATSLAFTDENTLFTCGSNGLLRWDLETGAYERILRTPPGASLYMSVASVGRKMLVYQSRVEHKTDEETVTLFDPETGETRELEIPTGRGTLQLSPDATLWVAFEDDGTIKVGRIAGGDPHLLLGHEGPSFFGTAISPDNQWIASGGTDETIRLWPMPDLSKPPMYTLPYDELIAKLHSLTNIRVVRDEESATGWKIEVSPFPGWAEMPTW